MALAEEDVKRIGDYVKPWLRDTVLEMIPRRPAEVDTQLVERIVRVEEELKAQRELMAVRFDAADSRFEHMIGLIDSRFEQVDKRFEDVLSLTHERFDAMDRRFEDARSHSDLRFEAMDKRFEDARSNSDLRFDAMDKRLDDARSHSDRRFALLQWTTIIGFTVVTAAMTFFALFI